MRATPSEVEDVCYMRSVPCFDKSIMYEHARRWVSSMKLLCGTRNNRTSSQDYHDLHLYPMKLLSLSFQSHTRLVCKTSRLKRVDGIDFVGYQRTQKKIHMCLSA